MKNFSPILRTADTNCLFFLSFFAQLLPAAVLWREPYIHIQVCILVIAKITALRPFVWRLSTSEEWNMRSWSLPAAHFTFSSPQTEIENSLFIRCVSNSYSTVGSIKEFPASQMCPWWGIIICSDHCKGSLFLLQSQTHWGSSLMTIKPKARGFLDLIYTQIRYQLKGNCEK